ncbi:MAG: GldG family protein [Burkholderiales bacterium]
MNNFFRSGLILVAGVGLLLAAAAIHAVLLEGSVWNTLIAIAGLLLAGWGGFSLRSDLGALIRQQRGEIVLFSAGIIGILVAIGYLSLHFTARIDMTESGEHSLSEQTVAMLKRLDTPVHVTFFQDPTMRETVERYELMASQTDKLKVEFFDPVLNPAVARMRGVLFAGTSLLESGERKLTLSDQTETEIANAILRISQGVSQKICFLDGHREADPFSLEAHDHMEGGGGHAHGLGAEYTTHQQHGMAKARSALETLNYTVEKLALTQSSAVAALKTCSLLIAAGSKLPYLPQETQAIRKFLREGGSGFFLLDPFIETGLEPVLTEYGIVADDSIIIDESSHFWADPSAPAVTDYNFHPIAQDLPLTFFPGARSLSPTSTQVPGTTVIPLINSSKQSYGETDPKRAQRDKSRDLQPPLTIMAIAARRPITENDDVYDAGKKKVSPAVMEIARAVTSRSRIGVIGDADFATNSFFNIMGNGRLFLNTVNYLASKENLIGLQPKSRDIPRVNLTNRQMKGTFFIAVVLIPALLAALGFAVWWKQR